MVPDFAGILSKQDQSEFSFQVMRQKPVLFIKKKKSDYKTPWKKKLTQHIKLVVRAITSVIPFLFRFIL